MKTHYLTAPLSKEHIMSLRVGDQVFLSGTIYMARDAAHKRMVDLLEKGQDLPVDLKGHVVFYGGPAPTRPGDVIGVVAPTTAYRMDPYTPAMYKYGINAAIGKGNRRDYIKEACKEYEAVSFSAVGGISATLYKCIKAAEVVAYEDLKTEAIQRLEIEKFPLLVTYDAYGQDLYEQEISKYGQLLK